LLPEDQLHEPTSGRGQRPLSYSVQLTIELFDTSIVGDGTDAIDSKIIGGIGISGGSGPQDAQVAEAGLAAIK
jgi:uncharacterized protein GlcG (DUF336 family)